MIDNLSYNPLGLLGPIHPRPEYRPPASREESPAAAGDSAKNNAKQSQVKDNQRVAQSAKNQSSRLNLAEAKELTVKVNEAISRLSPTALNGGPHRLNPYWGLYSSRYV
ncbi:MAG: hypothetical protein LBI10_01270 [Deltaproteobacteria bacterium]|jgi:hypothetical protein|nr:hypothetical protein [Deltaproteobacteria bacterium]